MNKSNRARINPSISFINSTRQFGSSTFECSEPITIKLSKEAFKLMQQTEYDIETPFLKNQIYHEDLRGWGGEILGKLLLIAAAAYLNVSHKTLMTFRPMGLEIVEIGRLRRVSKTALDEFMQKHSFQLKIQFMEATKMTTQKNLHPAIKPYTLADGTVLYRFTAYLGVEQNKLLYP